MIGPRAGTRVWLAAGVTDMRCGIDSLAAKVQMALTDDPFSGHVFAFRGRRGDLVKLLWSFDNHPMPTFTGLRVEPPKSWEEFESIVCSAAQSRWCNPDFTRHGRQGQPQHGVDVYGKTDEGRLVGLQCKNTASSLSEALILAEVVKAEAFEPKITHLYIATTADTDKTLQQVVREVSARRLQAAKFEVSILFWDDIWNDLARDEARLFQHYPQLKPAPVSTALEHDRALYEKLMSFFGFDPAIRLLRDHDFGGSFPRSAVQPLYDFYETWDQPQREFVDGELQAGLKELYGAAANMSNHLVGKTVPVGSDSRYASVFSDQLRAQGARPPWVLEEARVLNEEARKFVPLYEAFVRLCRAKLIGG